MLPVGVAAPLDEFTRSVDRTLEGRLAAVYLVGGAALGDFSERFSNIDVVVVADPPLSPAEISGLARAERRLERAGRPAAVWYTGWDELADGPGSADSGAAAAGAAGAGVAGAGAAASGGPGVGPSELETPLTRFLLQEEAVAVTGPDWPVVAYEEAAYRRWCVAELRRLAEGGQGMMVMRRGVSSLVLQAARLAQGAATGRVFSKSEAGETATTLVPVHFRRILNDSVGFRNGAKTSMYWGPFERKYDARRVIRELLAAVGEGSPPS